MNLFKSLGLVGLSVMIVSLIVSTTGCENDGGDNTVVVVTNTVNNVHHDNSSSSSSGSSSGNNGGNNNGGNPPPASEANVAVVNNSSNTIHVTVNGVGKDISHGNSMSWNYSGSTFTISFPSGAGYNVSETYSDGADYMFTISDSSSVPGTVEMSGGHG